MRVSSRGLPILTFHAVDDRRDPLAFPADRLRVLLASLHHAGWRTLDLGRAVELLAAGGAWPERSFVITFDDGFRSVHDAAFPILGDYGFTATVFLSAPLPPGDAGFGLRPTPFADREMLCWNEILRMADAGFSFGAHTLTHPDLTRLTSERAREEIVGSKRIIEEALGKPVAAFAFPFGRTDRRRRGLVAEAGFSCACTVRLALARAGDDPLALPRVDAYYLRSRFGTRLALSPLLSPYLTVRRVPRELRARFMGVSP